MTLKNDDDHGLLDLPFFAENNTNRCHCANHTSQCLKIIFEQTFRSVFKIIFVKFANFRKNISEAQGCFLCAFVRSKSSAGKHYEIFTTLGRKNSEFDLKPLNTVYKIYKRPKKRLKGTKKDKKYVWF